MSTHWKEYFEETFQKDQPWLNYPNERCQAQTRALALEALGPVAETRCLDVGCGYGQASLVLSVLGAEVVAIDIAEDAIRSHRAKHPHIRWETANLSDPHFGKDLGRFDRILALEVLQYTNPGKGLRKIWTLLSPSGRIVGTVPNPDCPIVQRTMQRFDGAYSPPSLPELITFFRSDKDVEYWGLRGMGFMADQRIAPYVASSWSNDSSWPEPPNRILFVAAKRD